MATAVNPLDPAYITQQLTTLYSGYGQKPGAPGSGALDAAYYTQQIINTGGWSDQSATGGANNIGYWTNRINGDLTKAGYTPTTSPTTGTTPPSTAAPAPGAGTRPPNPNGRTPSTPGDGTIPTTVVGNAVPIGSAANAALASPYAAAYAAAEQARRRSAGSGRASTILGGFTPGTPTIAPATLMGRAA